MVLTYKGMHTKLRRELGPASDYMCDDCGKPANEWSFEGGNDQDLDNYGARCYSCHRKYDGFIPPSFAGKSSACKPGCTCRRHTVKPGTRGGANYCEPGCECGRHKSRRNSEVSRIL